MKALRLETVKIAVAVVIPLLLFYHFDMRERISVLNSSDSMELVGDRF